MPELVWEQKIAQIVTGTEAVGFSEIGIFCSRE